MHTVLTANLIKRNLNGMLNVLKNTYEENNNTLCVECNSGTVKSVVVGDHLTVESISLVNDFKTQKENFDISITINDVPTHLSVVKYTVSKKQLILFHLQVN